MIDAWLLELFPGRTLEELDQMDLNRLQRAKMAARLQAVESRRKLLLEGKITGDKIERDEWALIQAMDEWLNEQT